MNILKLKPLIESLQTAATPAQEPKKEWTAEMKKEALAKIAEYNKHSKSLYRERSLMEVAHELSEIAKMAKELALHETEQAAVKNESWFNARIVEKNFKTIDGTIAELTKCAKEIHLAEQQLQACYEDVGKLLERYYKMENLQEGETASCKI